jgi:hypothetical protein
MAVASVNKIYNSVFSIYSVASMTEHEKRLFDHLVQKRLSWKTFKTSWDFNPRRYKLENAGAILYQRTKDQLEEFAKSSRKRAAPPGEASSSGAKKLKK